MLWTLSDSVIIICISSFIECTLSTKFPYLNTPGMPETERRRLIRRLQSETDNMKRKFAVLVCRTMDRLKDKRRIVEDLIVLLATLNERHGNKITKKLRKKANINEAFLTLNKFWSFFECDILSSIIDGFCSELKTELEDYISSLKEYCKRRICEVPSNSCISRVVSKSGENKSCTLKSTKSLLPK